ncbi:glycosyltransferase family 4 protein, partial [bacterium]|nr:glycosyltransferase family 4 protein [bacterium]
ERTISVPWYKKLEAGPSWQKPMLDILLLAKTLSVAKRFRPDVIHAHLHEGAFIGFFVSLLMKRPLLFDYQGSMTEEMVDHRFIRRGSFLFKIFKMIEGWIDKKADAIVLSSSSAREHLESEFGISPHKVFSVTDGVDTEIFKPDYSLNGLREQLAIPKGRKIILYLGLLNEYQGVDLLVNAAREVLDRLPDVHFLIMGYPNVERYKQLTGELGIADNVTFTGKVNYAKAPHYLCIGDIAVSAKLSKTEANGKLLNYAASGLPTVCFDTLVNREILGDTAVYTEFGNPSSFASAIVSLLKDDANMESLSRRTRDRAVKELSWNKAGERLLSAYQEILQKN